MNRAISQQRLVHMLLLVAVLLVSFQIRMSLLHHRNFDSDEVRLIRRSEGNVAQVIAWQPTDWPPLFNLVVSSWLHAVSNHPIVLRVVVVLWSLFGIAATYRVSQHLYGNAWSGFGAMLALAAVIYHMEFSIYLRGYIMAVALFPMTLWLTLRYFERPHWRRALSLALSIAMMFYTTYVSILAFAIIGVITILEFGLHIWRWWMPVMLSFVLVLPELLHKYTRLLTRFNSAEGANIQQAQSIAHGIEILQDKFFGSTLVVWIVLFGLVSLILLLKQRRTIAWVFLGLLLLAPFLLYAIVEARIIYHFHHRYVWWALLPMSLFIGAGVASAPRAIQIAIITILIGLTVFNRNVMAKRGGDYETAFKWIAENARAGDILVRDSGVCPAACGHGRMTWNYYEDYYLRDVVPRTNQLDDARRIWYVRASERIDRNLAERIGTGRIPADFVDGSQFFIQQWIAPPNPEGIRYDNGMRFHGLDILDEADNHQVGLVEVKEQTTMRVRLWWSVDEALTQDYSVSLRLITNKGKRLDREEDAPPQPIHLQLSHPGDLPQSIMAWEAGQIYVEERTIDIPDLDSFYVSHLYIIVYDWRDGTRFNAGGVNDAGILRIPQEIFVAGW